MNVPLSLNFSQLDFVKPLKWVSPRDLGARHVVSEQVVKLTSWVGIAPKRNRKQPQGSMLEELAEDLVAPPESIGEEEPMPREDQDEPASEEEQRSSLLFTQE
jgi:hypothetical protein